MVTIEDAGINIHTYFCVSSVTPAALMHFSVSFRSDSVSTPSPRLCVLKREEGESYGFNLRVESGRQGHIIRNVVSGGVAGFSGLKDGDRLLEVNNCFVEDVPHPEVRWTIRSLFQA